MQESVRQWCPLAYKANVLWRQLAGSEKRQLPSQVQRGNTVFSGDPTQVALWPRIVRNKGWYQGHENRQNQEEVRSKLVVHINLLPSVNSFPQVYSALNQACSQMTFEKRIKALESDLARPPMLG
jgi:hypothetical protein